MQCVKMEIVIKVQIGLPVKRLIQHDKLVKQNSGAWKCGETHRNGQHIDQ